MAILKIARMGHPVLRGVAAPVADPTAPEIRRLVADMTETLADIGGAGLAAPQVHVPLRVVIFRVPEERVTGDDDDRPQELLALVNPVIEPVGEARELGWEGCLSVPGLRGAVMRFTRIRYRATTPDGGTIERTAAGFHARVVQHECDHLDGILYPQRMSDLRLLVFNEEGARFPIDLWRDNGAGDGVSMDEAARKDALLAALMPDVAFDGWTWEAMRAAARRIDMAEDELLALFPDGPRGLVEWFSHWADRLTLETMASRPLDGVKLGARIAQGVETRLALLAPHREAVRRGLGLLALPQNAALGARLLYDTVDALWYAAGDTATDFSFYTKRGILAGIYAATTLFWLDDRSLDGAATKSFLERRLAEVAMLPRLRARVEHVLDVLPNPLRLLRRARPRF